MSALFLLVVSLIALTIRAISIAIYRITLHPLAGIPGPKSAAITRFYEFVVDFFVDGGGRFAYEIDRLHGKYGPIVRIGPNEVHIDDSGWLKQLYGRPGSIRNKDPVFASALGNNLGAFGTEDHHIHRMRRSALNPFFSKKSTTSVQPRIKASIDRLCKVLKSHHDSAQLVDVRVVFLAWSTDSVTSYIFDQSTNLLDDYPKATEWWKMYDGMRGIFPILIQFPWITSIALKLPVSVLRVVMPNFVPLKRVHQNMQEQAVAECNQYMAVGEDKSSVAVKSDEAPNLFQALLQSDLPELEKQHHRLAHEGFEVLLAGAATFARVTALGIYHILADKKIHETVMSGLHNAFPDPSSMPDVRDVESIPYMVAVVKESLRLSQLVAIRQGRTAPTETLVYDQYKLPAGTVISMTQADALVDPRVFPEPRSFIPERWLGPNRTEEMERFFVPFGAGSRMCLGINYAMDNMYIMLATVMLRFDLEVVDTVRERDVQNSRVWFIGEVSASSPGMRLKVAGARAF